MRFDKFILYNFDKLTNKHGLFYYRGKKYMYVDTPKIFCSSDDKYLYRTAKGLKDYMGGRNQWTSDADILHKAIIKHLYPGIHIVMWYARVLIAYTYSHLRKFLRVIARLDNPFNRGHYSYIIL